MKLLFRFGVLVLFFVGIIFLDAKSQTGSNPLEPEKAPLKQEVGLLLGLGPNWQSGEFKTDCDCYYSKGGGFGFSFGGFIEKELVRKTLRYGAAVYYDSRAITASYSELKTFYVAGDTMQVDGKVKHSADASFANLSIMPYLKLELSKAVYFRLGFSGSYVLSNNSKHTEELLTRTAILKGTDELVTLSLSRDSMITSRVVEDHEFTGTNSMQFSLEPAFGANFHLSEKMLMGFSFQYSLPLTVLASRGGDLKMNAWRFFLSLSYDFTKKGE